MSRTRLNFLQREVLATWLRNNYVQQHLTDPQAVTGAQANHPVLLAELNMQHVAYMRQHLGIAKNYVRKPRAEEAPQVDELTVQAVALAAKQGEIIDHLSDQLEAQREIVQGLNRSLAQLGQRVRQLEADSKVPA